MSTQNPPLHPPIDPRRQSLRDIFFYGPDSTPIFKQYFLRAVTRQVTTFPFEDPDGDLFPLAYMQEGTYKTNPNQREEIKAYRDDNTRDLTRVTAEGKKTTIEFKLRSVWLEEKMYIQAWFHNAEANTQEAHEQRKVQLEFWDEEENAYKTGYFYRPNLEFEIDKTEGYEIKYKPLTIKLVEY